MHILRRLAVFLAVLPLLELVVFVAVASTVGFWNAVLLTVATSAIGALLLRRAGQTNLRQFQHSVSEGLAISGNVAGPGLFTLLAGLLLLLPGFLTDLIAVLMLVPQVRRLFAAMVLRTLQTEAAKPPPGVVDLEPGEWRDEPQTSIPRRPAERHEAPDASP
jgi:UPF0716 family protein affecting phage T7 exclusion